MLICYLALLILCSWSKFVLKNVRIPNCYIHRGSFIELTCFFRYFYLYSKMRNCLFSFFSTGIFFILFFFFKLNYRISLFWLFKELLDSLIKDNLKIKCDYSLFYFYCLKKGNSITKNHSSISVNRHIYLW